MSRRIFKEQKAESCLGGSNSIIMKSIVAKCKVVHFGRSNLETNYQIQDEYFNYKIIETTESVRELGIIVSSK